MVTFLGMVTILGMATIVGMMTNDHFRDGGHPWGRLEDLDHFGEGDLLRDGDCPRYGNHHRYDDHLRDVSQSSLGPSGGF